VKDVTWSFKLFNLWYKNNISATFLLRTALDIETAFEKSGKNQTFVIWDCGYSDVVYYILQYILKGYIDSDQDFVVEER
jgi:hypothetical protein